MERLVQKRGIAPTIGSPSASKSREVGEVPAAARVAVLPLRRVGDEEIGVLGADHSPAEGLVVPGELRGRVLSHRWPPHSLAVHETGEAPSVPMTRVAPAHRTGAAGAASLQLPPSACSSSMLLVCRL